MKIAMASLGDPASVTTWSGIPLSIFKQLEKHGHEVIGIPLEKSPEPWDFAWRRRLHHRLEGKWFLGSVEKRWLSRIARNLDEKVNEIKPDVVIAIHADWLAYSSFTYPSIVIHDTTFDSILDYYPSFTNLCRRSIANGHEMYQRALDKCAAAIFSAEWATRSAVSRYKLSARKAFTIPFGPNLAYTPQKSEIYQWVSQRAAAESCDFVFIGTQWERKGGPEALAFVIELNRLGVKATLNIVGCSPWIDANHEKFIRRYGFLRKENADHVKTFMTLLERSHALIVLSQAECYGCVYCEANAYGLPAIGRDTGGVAEIIIPGVNGLLLENGQTVQTLASEFKAIWLDKEKYTALALSSYEQFENRLSLDVFGDELESVLNKVIRKQALTYSSI